jgi:hypothetical protein
MFDLLRMRTLRSMVVLAVADRRFGGRWLWERRRRRRGGLGRELGAGARDHFRGREPVGGA